MIRKWLTLKGDQGKVLLNISPDKLSAMNRNQLRELYEKISIRIIRELNFSNITRVNTFYDIEAEKQGDKYCIEVKGKMSNDVPYIAT